MALPVALLKAKSAIKKGRQAYAAGKQAKSLLNEGTLIVPLLKKYGLLIIPPIVMFVFLLITIVLAFYALPRLLIIDFGKNSNTNNNSVLTLDQATLERYYQASEAANRSNNRPDQDLSSTEYKNIEGFNQYIKNQVNKVGYGTRGGVVTAGITLVGDYILATGKRLRYSQSLRQKSDVEGIQNKNFYLDCSSFTWWAVYNGGYKMPSYPQTLSQMKWAREYQSLNSSVINGKPGDFLVNAGHIVLILGSYDDGYYCAEFAGTASGAKISKRSMNSLSNSRYNLIDMEKYYNDPANIR